ncbi:cytochrome c family protein [Pelagibius litoralis]|uniref:Cytochrome c family protein n=2 Tax=Pelagibius litoralis TaxID=374515 RepID=A0A967KBM1_9PROT|nr:cytochrome c family protein [Pelagibius litoralis]
MVSHVTGALAALACAASFPAILTTSAAAQEAAGDPAAGERVYRQCATCHSVAPGENRAGPHLFGIVGQSAGAVEGFRYSRAMREADIVWDDETLTAYLIDPLGFLPGTTMRVGLRNPDDAADLIAYLRTLSTE